MRLSRMGGPVMCAVAGALSACGGAGGGSTAFIPAPPTSPAPSVGDPNPVAPAMPAGAVGLTGGPFTTFSASADPTNLVAKDEFHINYSPDGNVYTVSGPGVAEGHLIDSKISGGSWMNGSTTWQTISGTSSFVTAGNATVPQESATVWLDWANAPYSDSNLKYTSYGSWSGTGAGGLFVYGTTAPASAIPTSGAATYSGDIHGYTSGDGSLLGHINLDFNFAAGSLAGSLTGWVSDPTGWDALSIGNYSIAGSLLGGSAGFSGSLSAPGSSASSSLSGVFTGPDASELMGSFVGPYLSPNTQQWGTMNGVFLGQKPH